MNEELETKEGYFVGKVILFVDDNDSIRTYNSFPLRAQGATVLTAQNGQEGLDIIQESIRGDCPRFDLIITDYEMPIMDGEELLEALGESDHSKNIPFIFSSGAFTEELEERLSKDPRVKSFLEKPFSFDELITTVRKVFK